MQYNLIKRSGLKVSKGSFGCMSLKAEYTDNDAIISKAIEGGINLFDTADLYEKGANEALLGKALKGRRQEVLISTKVGNRWKPNGSGWDWDPSKKHILTAVDDSLRRLQTDHIDLYLLHGGTTEDPIDEVVEAFERLVDSGKIRSYGLSSIRPNVIREYVSRSNISAVMTQYSLLDRRPEEETLKLLLDNEIGVLARGALASGLLVDKPAKNYLDITKEQITNILTGFANALPEGRRKSEAALRYVVDNEATTTAVVGIRTLEQLEDVMASTNASPLTTSQLEELQQVWPGNQYKDHR